MRDVRTVRVFLLLAGVSVTLPSARPAAQEPTPPQFRAAIDLTRLELTVLDKRTRKPIKGLTAGDFVVKVGGDVQPVEALAEVAGVGNVSTPAPAFTAAAHDVASNSGPRPRVFVIVMNDAAGLNDPFDRKTGKGIAHAIVDGLSPGDMAAVIFTRDNRHAQDFTYDRTLLRSAIERFNPMFTAGTNALSVVRRSQAFLSGMPGYRRAIVYITPLTRKSRIGDIGPEDVNAFGIDEDAEAAEREMRAIRTGGQIGHVPIYTYSTHGLDAPKVSASGLIDLGWQATEHDIAMRRIAMLTGGRATVANNAPAQMVPAMFEELASYYAVGFRPTYPLDGKLRWLQVQVKHPNAMVMPSGVPIATTKALASAGSNATPPMRRDSGLAEALSAPVPFGAVPLRLSSLPFAVSGKRHQALALTLWLPPVAAGEKEQFRVRLMVFDGEGRRELRSQTQDVSVTGGTREGTEVVIRLAQPPGRYNLRLIAERLSTKAAGSVHATVTIPDFATATLSMSGVAIGFAEGRPIAGRESLSDILPFGPTAIRSFAPGDRVGALVRVHQSAERPAQTVTLETEIIDAGGRVVTTATKAMTEAAFVGGTGGEHRYELPLVSLEAGDYLLRFVATAGESRVQRDVRFSVRR